MGAQESKPSAAQVWKASGPNSISQELVDSLQMSPETDASRQRTAELHIQARVADELKKLQRKQNELIKTAHDKATADDANYDGGSGDDGATSSYKVGKEIEALRHRLEERKQVRPLPDGVDAARAEVVRCLRENDRRPLDCWVEVERFKAEVKKMEDGWVDKVTS